MDGLNMTCPKILWANFGMESIEDKNKNGS